MASPSRRIALFGGTFDPVHSAHIEVAREAARRFSLSKVLLVPAACPPHKARRTSAPYEDRFHMVELACQGDPVLEPSRLEAESQCSYSILTIERVRALIGPQTDLYFLIGADAFAEIQTWYRWQDVIEQVEFIVVSRPGHEYAVPPAARLHRLDSLALPVSSSLLRARLAVGEQPQEIPAPVLTYIGTRGLYRNPQ